MSGYVMVTTTMDTEQGALELARRIVTTRHAACVQVEPINSVYHWQGAIETADEFRLTAKTTEASAPDLIELITNVHPYEVPEILVTPIAGGSLPYLEWIAAETGAVRSTD